MMNGIGFLLDLFFQNEVQESLERRPIYSDSS